MTTARGNGSGGSRGGRPPIGAMLERMESGDPAAGGAAAAPPPAAGSAAGSNGSGELPEEALRAAAEERGYTLMRLPERRGVRPKTVRGRVKMSYKVDAELRKVLEQVRLQTNMSFEEIVDTALREYLLKQGFQVEAGSVDPAPAG